MTKKSLLSFAHRIAGIIALMMLLIFWFSTVITELMGNVDYIKNVKSCIPYGFILLIPALMIVGGTGFKLAGKSQTPILQKKKTRMPFIAFNGLAILIPCAFYLRYLAIHEQFDLVFVFIQIIELIVGGINIALLILNVKAGLQLVKNKQVKTSKYI
ncbi:hypothetical protein [Commensalibacter communis]|uniref:hypothetical protein n=1 Tax=Commensalibacter communis TaxID=2972786 RepID=UPI0022FF761A|nr:hypothetical protein [Commensalibacter communis]CAI3950561.1 unnamed protein product [Commensalibacter communis]CAI3956020.1 unnamed protein product [Commensalibacter communis]